MGWVLLDVGRERGECREVVVGEMRGEVRAELLVRVSSSVRLCDSQPC